MNIVLFSGGVDSLVTVIKLKEQKKEFKCLYVNYGHRYNTEEWSAVFSLAFDLKLDTSICSKVDLAEVEKENAEIPFRNLDLIVTAAMMGATDIYLSVESGTFENESRDRSPEFISHVSDFLSWMSKDEIRVHNLVGEMTKQDEMSYIMSNIFNSYLGKIKAWELLLKTFSCCRPIAGKMCGNCKMCLRWFLAAEGIGLRKTDWITDPLKSSVFKEYVDATKKGVYSGRRGDQYIEVFKKLEVW